ncbi:MAG: monofunctional biosynthetic peptidoglycan transglycosylase [Bacteroidetes bacterium]|nr:monofunctional biosynthetic peptidoglycan transglycosylase [Bacteroidota bacterium]
MKKINIKTLFNKIKILALKLLLVFFLFSLLQVLLLKWIDPLTSSVMFQREFNLFSSDEKPISYEWYNYDDISKEIALAVIASEDQNFPSHFGFDFEQIGKAFKEKNKRGSLRGASTITQQVAKNLFLWEGKSFIRKGLEAYYTILIEVFWSKRRIMEIYINIAEMGDNIFGVGIVSKIYLKKIPAKLTKQESALIAAVLPNPKKFSVKNPSVYVRKRQAWILEQMHLLRGIFYIKNL